LSTYFRNRDVPKRKKVGGGAKLYFSSYYLFFSIKKIDFCWEIDGCAFPASRERHVPAQKETI
jgi:hypothetical protein